MARILVVDDAAVCREPLAKILELSGYEVSTASDGAEALTLLTNEPPAVVILDLMLPKVSGLAVLRAMRGSSKLCNVPVIILSAAGDKGAILEASRLGVRDYMLKAAFSLDQLLSRVRKYADGGSLPAPGRSPAAGAPTHKPDNRLLRPTIQAASGSAASAATVANASLSPEDLNPPRLLTREQCVERAEKAMEAKAMAGVVAQVMSVAGSPRGDTPFLAALISKDPLLSARVLQAANSAAYASARGPVSTVADAIRQVGCSTVRNIAAVVGVAAAMPAADLDGFDPVRCWQHSFAVATLCEQLVGEGDAEQPAGIAYLVGLCHDLGEILFRSKFGPECRQVSEWEQRTARPRAELERIMLGMTRGELVQTALKGMGLPEAIRLPIEGLHATRATDATRGGKMTRVLRLADVYANGMLLASGGGAPVCPVHRAECKAVTGKDDPATPDAEQVRAEIFTMTAMLARPTSQDDARLMAPLHPRTGVRVWLARDPAYSTFDPLSAALSALAEVTVNARLPAGADAEGYTALVVVARDTTVAGFTPADITRATAGLPGQPLATLWLTGRNDGSATAQPIRPTPLPATIDMLAEFVRGVASGASGATDSREAA